MNEEVRKPAFWHTICIDEAEMRTFNRTVITPLPKMWVCKFCKVVNAASEFKCSHCGAPRTEDCKAVDL